MEVGCSVGGTRQVMSATFHLLDLDFGLKWDCVLMLFVRDTIAQGC